MIHFQQGEGLSRGILRSGTVKFQVPLTPLLCASPRQMSPAAAPIEKLHRALTTRFTLFRVLPLPSLYPPHLLQISPTACRVLLLVMAENDIEIKTKMLLCCRAAEKYEPDHLKVSRRKFTQK